MLKWTRLPLRVVHRTNSEITSAENRQLMADNVRALMAKKTPNELLPHGYRNKRWNATYVTCPIYYASGSPHIGHLHTSVIGDFYHRWFQVKHYNSYLATGTDEHGTKIVRNYHQNKFKYDSIDDFVDSIASEYRSQFEKMRISVDERDGGRFTRTTDEKHKKSAIKMWNKIKHNIKLEEHEGWYSYNDEVFVPETKQIIDEKTGKRYAADSMHELELVAEENYFFDFSEYLDGIELYIRTAVKTANIKKLLNEIEQYRKDPSKAKLCVSRPNKRMIVSNDRTWGVPVPTNPPSHQMYVWFEALCSYITSIENEETGKLSMWPITLQVVGVDILNFHAIYLPAILLAAEMPLPRALLVHGHWTNNGEKMGKSKANYISFDEMSDVVNGQVDAIRWFLLSNLSGSNKNYSPELLRIMTDRNLGQILTRAFDQATSEENNPYQTYPHFDEDSAASLPSLQELVNEVRKLPEVYEQKVNNGDLGAALESVITVVKRLIKFQHDHRLGRLDRSDLDQRYYADTVLHCSYEVLRVCAILLQPAVPGISEKILNRLGVPLENRFLEDAQDSFGVLEGEEYERAGRNLGPGQGEIFESSRAVEKQASFIAHLEEREMIRQEKMLSTKPIYAYENKQKKKEKKFNAKMRARKRQQKKRKKEKLDSGMYGLEDF